MRKKFGLYDPFYEHDACGVGFVANIDGARSHEIVEQGITVLKNLEHRGAIGGDQKTGDGAGMIIQIPHRFFTEREGLELPDEGRYCAGFFFLPRDTARLGEAKELIEAQVEGIGEVVAQRQDLRSPEPDDVAFPRLRDEVVQLLSHLTEEQWASILDLDLWTRDEVSVERFLKWAQFITQVEDPVARKILLGTNPTLWQLAFKRDLGLFVRTEEDEFETGSEQGSFLTPEGHYLVVLPEDAEKARLYSDSGHAGASHRVFPHPHRQLCALGRLQRIS